MLIELDAFSGRPSPRWELDASAERDLRQMLGGLSDAPGEAQEPADLGYRGFRFDIDTAGGASRAFRGRVVVAGRLLDDPGRAVERFLLGTAPSGLGAVGDAVAAELDS